MNKWMCELKALGDEGQAGEQRGGHGRDFGILHVMRSHLKALR